MILRAPAFRVFVFQYLSARMAHLMALIDDVAFRRVDQRLASRLLNDTETLAVTHQMLADELGTTREVVSRTLEAFQESGFLRLGRKRIEVLDRTALLRVQRPADA
jgi:CRP/FNR family transcriptional regulator